MKRAASSSEGLLYTGRRLVSNKKNKDSVVIPREYYAAAGDDDRDYRVEAAVRANATSNSNPPKGNNKIPKPGSPE